MTQPDFSRQTESPEDSPQQDIVAEFATHAFAQDAEQALKEAGFDQVTIDVAITPEEMKAVSTQKGAAPVPSSSKGSLPVALPIAQTLEANATARLVVATALCDEAMVIIKAKGGKLIDERAREAELAKKNL